MTRAAVLAGVGSAPPQRREVRSDAFQPAVAAGARTLTGELADRVDTVLVTGTTPERAQAPRAADVAAGLGLTDTAAYNWPAAEDAFLLALAGAACLIETGSSDCALVVGTGDFTGRADAPSSARDIGAGALLLRAGDPDEPGALGRFELAGGTERVPAAVSATVQGRPRPSGAAVRHGVPRFGPESSRAFWRTVQRMGQAAQKVLDRAGWTADDVDTLMVFQEHHMMTRRLADELGIPAARGISAAAAAGRARSTSFPLALDHARATGALSPGHHVLLAACHGDPAETWGATALIWPRLEGG